MAVQQPLCADNGSANAEISTERFLSYVSDFTWNQRTTTIDTYRCNESGRSVPVFINEFWTSQQRAAHSLHEISYRACFKPQLPRFFIAGLTNRGDYVYDPFAGRGTTLIEAALLSRSPAGSDVNPLSATLILPRLAPPTAREVDERLASIDLNYRGPLPDGLLAFYHPETLSDICALRQYLSERFSAGTSDRIDDWIRMVAVNRLTGHSSGFLSVYTLPPNQAVSIEAQRKINAVRNQAPPHRDVRAVIARKTRSLLSDVEDVTLELLAKARRSVRFRVGSCLDSAWDAGQLQLVVTSPPFLDIVDYATDNWLRCWFCGVEARDVPIELHRDTAEWAEFIERAFREFDRLLQPGGYVAFEVGEVRRGSIRLEEIVLPRGMSAGFSPVCFVVNDQNFTKTANIWGVSNNSKGTNTNRIVVFEKLGK